MVHSKENVTGVSHARRRRNDDRLALQIPAKNGKEIQESQETRKGQAARRDGRGDESAPQESDTINEQPPDFMKGEGSSVTLSNE